MPRIAILIILAGFISCSALHAQQKDPRQPTLLFQSGEILELDLEADFKAVFSNSDDSTEFPATISFTDNSGKDTSMEIKMRTRGKTRREKDVCHFSPLRLNFPKKETGNTPFEGQNAIKLVTHCAKSGHYEQNTIMEYLIYKAYNVLTDSSFEARPAMINYIQSRKKADTTRKFAFFIEKEKHLADRLQGIELEGEKIHPNRLNSSQTCLMDMFQYMIGNTDYSIYELHNVILVTDSTRLFPPIAIPYDFDWSGMVSAVYAEPHPLIGTEHVSERIYRGFKKEAEHVYQAIHRFNTKKQEIYQVFENFELLDDDQRKRAVKYLDEFYLIINNERKVQTEFFDNARVLHN